MEAKGPRDARARADIQAAGHTSCHWEEVTEALGWSGAERAEDRPGTATLGAGTPGRHARVQVPGISLLSHLMPIV